MRFENKRVLVTGGTRGIGAAIAKAFETEGASVIITGTKHQNQGGMAKRSDSSQRLVPVDLDDDNALCEFLAFIESQDLLDVLINNAGINIIKPFDEVLDEDFDRLTRVNYRAPFLISRAAGRVMKRQKSGRIVNIGSIWSLITKAGRTQYCASKAGVAGMTRAFATDLAPAGVLVNCVSPGFVLTDLTKRSLTDDEIGALAAQVPMGRMAQPSEIARVVLFLASNENTYLTGQNIVVDGGFSHV